MPPQPPGRDRLGRRRRKGKVSQNEQTFASWWHDEGGGDRIRLLHIRFGLWRILSLLWGGLLKYIKRTKSENFNDG